MIQHLFFFILFSQLSFFLLLSNTAAQSLEKHKKNTSASPISIKGRIINKSQNKGAKVKLLNLIKLEEGMQVVASLKNVGPNFLFPPVLMGKTPFLLQAHFANSTYNHLIPPTLNTQKKKQIINVYEDGASFNSVDVVVALHVKKKRNVDLGNFLDIKKIYVLNNHSTPPKSFDLSTKNVYIPKEAKKLQASLRYKSSNVPIPLAAEKFRKNGDLQAIQIHLHPGEALLEISYQILGSKLKDKHILIQERTPYRVLSWSPLDASPQIQGATFKTVEIPEFGKAYQVSYLQDNKELVLYDFSQGSYLVEDPLHSDFNVPFDKNWKVFVVILFLFTSALYLIAFINKRNLRNVRD